MVMMEPDVAQALRTGPFAVALDVAVDASGMTLERLAALLGKRGVSLSRATLSYWRSGRSQPERAVSMAALPVLEEVLHLPTGSLVALVRPRSGQPRAARRPPGSLSRRRVWPAGPALLAEIDAPPDGQIQTLAVNETFVVQAGTGGRLLRVRLVMRALRDGVGRTVVYYQADGMTDPAPKWAGLSRCRLGRVRTDAKVTVAELIFDRRLSVGEHMIIDYEQHFSADPTNSYHRSFTRPCGLWTCEVKFVGALPSRVFRFRRRHTDDDYRDVEEVWMGTDHVACTVAQDVKPGIFGLFWQF
jgi:transcriptional regulator with XRE-family HTH domain